MSEPHSYTRIRNSSIGIHWGQYCICKTFTVAFTFIVYFHFASSLHSHLNVCLSCMTMRMVFMTNLVLHFNKKNEKEMKGNKNIHHFYWQSWKRNDRKASGDGVLRMFIYLSISVYTTHSRCCYFAQNICNHTTWINKLELIKV